MYRDRALHQAPADGGGDGPSRPCARTQGFPCATFIKKHFQVVFITRPKERYVGPIGELWVRVDRPAHFTPVEVEVLHRPRTLWGPHPDKRHVARATPWQEQEVGLADLRRSHLHLESGV